MKIYLVVDSWVVDGKSGVLINAFDSFEKAIDCLKGRAKLMKKSKNYDTILESETSFYAYDKGLFKKNNFSMYIMESVVK